MHGVTQSNYALHLHTHSEAKKIVKYKQALKCRHVLVKVSICPLTKPN